MNAWDDPERREELDWTRRGDQDRGAEPGRTRGDPDRTDGLAELIRDAIDEETRGLVFPGAMAQRVIHGSRARRPWGRIHATLLVGMALVSGAGVVGAAAIVPALVSHGGEPTMTAPSTGVNPPPATPDPSRLVVVGYVPPGWRQVPPMYAPDGADVRVWVVQYEPVRGGRRTLAVRVAVDPDGFAEALRAEKVRGAVLRSYTVAVGRAVTVPPMVLGEGRPVETRFYWEPRAGLLVSVRGAGAPVAEVRKVISGLRLVA
jgi:hypothetical protein